MVNTKLVQLFVVNVVIMKLIWRRAMHQQKLDTGNLFCPARVKGLSSWGQHNSSPEEALHPAEFVLLCFFSSGKQTNFASLIPLFFGSLQKLWEPNCGETMSHLDAPYLVCASRPTHPSATFWYALTKLKKTGGRLKAASWHFTCSASPSWLAVLPGLWGGWPISGADSQLLIFPPNFSSSGWLCRENRNHFFDLLRLCVCVCLV